MRNLQGANFPSSTFEFPPSIRFQPNEIDISTDDTLSIDEPSLEMEDVDRTLDKYAEQYKLLRKVFLAWRTFTSMKRINFYIQVYFKL